MVVKFQKIQLHNFASYTDVTLDLNNMGFTLISGRNKCKLDNAYSNGSGKSALFNALCYVLTGETTQGISSGLENIFSNPDDCWVELSMIVDHDQFVIRRIKSPKQNLKVYVNGEDRSGKGIRESSIALQQYLPDLSVDLVNGIIILGQGMPRRFTNNKPSHRKELLENLTKSDFMIQTIKDKLEVRQDSLRSELRETEDNILSCNSQKEVYMSQLNESEEDLKLYDQYTAEGQTIEDLYNSVESDLKDTELKIEVINADLKYHQGHITSLEEDRMVLREEKQKELSKAQDEIAQEVYKVNTNKIEIKSEILNLKKEINKLKSITDICPTCKQKIPNVIKPDTKEQEYKLSDYELKLDLIDKELNDLSASKEECEFNITDKYKERFSEIDERLAYSKEMIEDLESQRFKLNTNKDTLTSQKYDLFNLKENYNKLQSNISQIKKSIEKLDNQIINLNASSSKINSHLDIIQQLLTLAKREFRGILLTNVIKFIDHKVKQYSKEVFGTENLSFTLNDNYIDITYCDKLYENLSGGEKQKIDIIVQLALRDILSRQLNIHFNVLVLDEIYDGLDAISCQKITNLISGLYDIDSVFIISHHDQELEITYDNNILVEKSEEGISTINYV